MCQERELKMKTCSKCKEDLPATKEYYHSHKSCKDGLNAVCKKCRSRLAVKRIRKTDFVPEGCKQCVECGKILEIHNNNFKLNAKSLDGYNNLCINCQIVHRRNGAEEGYKKCISCNNTYLLNRDYYQPSNKGIDGFRNICWECMGRQFFPNIASESWSNKDIEIIKNNYKDLSIYNIIPQLSVNRTEKAIIHMAQKLEIRKIESM
jgi:hypothetical protein